LSPAIVKSFSFPKRPGRLEGTPPLLHNRYPDYFLGVGRSGSQNYHLDPSNAEVTNEWSYTFIPPISLHGVDITILTLIRENVNVLILYRCCMNAFQRYSNCAGRQ
jgi:hypothetical protein